MVPVADDLELLPSDAVRGGPALVVLPHDVRLHDDALQLLDDGWGYEGLLADHRVVFIVAIVRVPQTPVGAELELEELVSELSLVPDVVAAVEILRSQLSACCRGHHFSSLRRSAFFDFLTQHRPFVVLYYLCRNSKDIDNVLNHSK